METFKVKTESSKVPVLRDNMWRNNIVSVTTWKMKHLSMGGKRDMGNKNTQVFHLRRAAVLKVSQTLHTASSHVSSHLL